MIWKNNLVSILNNFSNLNNLNNLKKYSILNTQNTILYAAKISESSKISQINNIIYFTPEAYLLTSIILETFSTILLKKTLINKMYFLPVYSGYAISFYIFPKALEKYSLSVAYTLWCGIGIILTTAVDKVLYREVITVKKIMGILAIIFGIFVSK
jgi:multidrug transporter EmrE-like cation transporter